MLLIRLRTLSQSIDFAWSWSFDYLQQGGNVDFKRKIGALHCGQGPAIAGLSSETADRGGGTLCGSCLALPSAA
jgi:hypothetical protein